MSTPDASSKTAEVAAMTVMMSSSGVSFSISSVSGSIFIDERETEALVSILNSALDDMKRHRKIREIITGRAMPHE